MVIDVINKRDGKIIWTLYNLRDDDDISDKEILDMCESDNYYDVCGINGTRKNWEVHRSKGEY